MKKVSLLIISIACLISLQAQTIFTEDFEGGVFPDTWEQETAADDGGWIVGNASELSSSGFPIEEHTSIIATNDDGCNCDKENDFLYTPSIDISLLENPFVKFDLYYFELTYDATENLICEISTDGGITWEVLVDLGYASDSWRTVFIDLADYAGLSDIKIGLRYNDGGGWLYGAAMDNFSVFSADLSVVDIVISSGSLGSNIEAVPIIMTGYPNYLVGKSMIVSATITNNAFVEINSFDISYTRGADNYTKSFSGLTLGAGSSLEINLEESPLNIVDGANDVLISISNINGGVIEDPIGNEYSANVMGVSPVSGVMVVAEEGTGSWCGWCVRGSVMMEYMMANYAQYFIPIAVHNGDPMVDDEYDGELGISAFPSAFINRQFIIDPLDFEREFMNNIGNNPGVIVTPNYAIDENRIITVNTTLDFTSEVNGDYAISVVFTEDEVTGTASGYKQSNYYSGGGAGLMGGYEDLPSSIAAADMVYEHVARGIANEFEGEDGSVPGSNASGSTHNYSTTWEIDEDFNIDQMHAIALLINRDNGEIINAGSVKLSSEIVEGVNNPQLSGVSIFPNPSSENVFVSIQLLQNTNVIMRITDLNGKVVAERNYGDLIGQQILPIHLTNFASGIYQIKIIGNQETITKQLVVTK